MVSNRWWFQCVSERHLWLCVLQGMSRSCRHLVLLRHKLFPWLWIQQAVLQADPYACVLPVFHLDEALCLVLWYLAPLHEDAGVGILALLTPCPHHLYPFLRLLFELTNRFIDLILRVYWSRSNKWPFLQEAISIYQHVDFLRAHQWVLDRPQRTASLWNLKLTRIWPKRIVIFFIFG